MKKCSKCDKEKAITEFDIRKTSKDKHTGVCSDCRRKIVAERKKRWTNAHRDRAHAANKQYRENNPDKIHSMKLQSRYGITFKDYVEMLAKQGGGCKICGRKDSGRKKQKYFSLDHDHVTGKIRGLLCAPCNTLIGLAQDNFSILIKASEYLKENFEYENRDSNE